jgi:hypothetical protein
MRPPRDQPPVATIDVVHLQDELDADGTDLIRAPLFDTEMEAPSPSDTEVAGLIHEHLKTERAYVELS